jgi:cation transport regulator ChaC
MFTKHQYILHEVRTTKQHQKYETFICAYCGHISGKPRDYLQHLYRAVAKCSLSPHRADILEYLTNDIDCLKQ